MNSGKRAKFWIADQIFTWGSGTDGEMRRGCVITVVDYNSSGIVTAKRFSEFSVKNFLVVLGTAVKEYGIPDVLYVDDSRLFRSTSALRYCENQGMALKKVCPTDYLIKGIAERSFRKLITQGSPLIYPSPDEPCDGMDEPHIDLNLKSSAHRRCPSCL